MGWESWLYFPFRVLICEITFMRLTMAGLIFSFSLIAQTGEYSITGVVVNAQTGEPVKYALVTLMGFQKPDSQQQGKFQPPLQKSTQAGAAGEFQFQGLGKANYNVSAQKPGFNMAF